MKVTHSRGASMTVILATVAVVAAVATVMLANTGRGPPRPGRPAAASTAHSAVPAPPAPGPEAPAPPSHGAYFGARVTPIRFTQAATLAAVRRLQHRLGRRLDIVHAFVKWHDPVRTSSNLAFLRQGSMLLLSWSGADTRAIAAGAYDDWIRQQARAVRAAGRRIFMEWRWEMDRPGLRAEIHSPANYKAAWDHIRSIFAQEHANNVVWVWCPTARGFANGNAPAYYPGDLEVDWICADAYPGPGAPRSFSDIVTPFLKWASRHPKPVIIGEYGVPWDYGPQLRARWLRNAALTVRGHPRVKALVYFDGNAKRAYSLPAGSPALRAFRAISRQDYFNAFHLP